MSAGLLLVCVAGIAVSAHPSETGVVARWAFVVCALGGAGASWHLAHAEGLTLKQVVGLAILCRLALFPMLPALSDDGYRYIWDGMLLTQAGISPYAYVPSDPALVMYHQEPIFALLNSPRYFSVYPPVSQAVFAVGGWVYESGWKASWFAIKGTLLVLEAIGIACLSRVVSARRVALYALHPIALIEIAGQGHTEGALVCALGLAIWTISRWPGWTGVALAMAGWVKLFPLVLAPLLGRHRLRWVGWSLGVAAGAVCLIPAGGVEHLMKSIALYGGTLDFYAAPFLIVKTILYPILGEGAGKWAGTGLSVAWAVSVVTVVLTRDGTAASFRSGLAIGVIGYAVLSPMQHPWNWLGVLLMLPLLQRAQPLFWIATLSLLTYLRYVGLESFYVVALVLGWGGGGALAIRAAVARHRAGEELLIASRTVSTDADSASIHR